MTPLRHLTNIAGVLRRAGQLLLITAFLAAVGGHWMILQTVAWTTMLADNLEGASVAEAVSKTFGGQNPCQLCKHIAAEKQSEQMPEATDIKVKKFDCAGGSSEFVFSAPAAFRLLPEQAPQAPVRSTAPPVPPPRACAA